MSESTGDAEGVQGLTDGIRERLDEFVRFRAEHLRGDEKGEAQIFLDRWFRALGFAGAIEAGAVLEERVRQQGRSVSFADLRWGNRVLIEMKKSGQNLALHYRQAFDYWIASVPNRPRYVILCNFDEMWIYDFDYQLDEPIDRIPLIDLPRRWEALGFMLPEERRPQFGNDLVAVTRQSAADLAALFASLTQRGVDREAARRFLLQCVMAMFSEDIGLLPTHSFTAAIQDSGNGTDAYDLIFGLFREMNTPGVTEGGRYAGTPYFNGGLYATVEPFSLTSDEVAMMANAATTDWSTVRPEIFGTLFEQSLGKEERHALGAHYTSPADIAFIVEPSLVRPWTERIDQAWDSIPDLERTLYELTQVQVLDPACGCGNFLYIAYREMRRLEQRITARIAERRRGSLGETPAFSLVSPHQFHGMDLNPFAVEIAKVTLMIAKKLSAIELDDHQNVLPLDNIDSNFIVGDALFTEWPAFDVCIGNPPYLGRQRVIEEHGPAYSSQLAEAFPGVEGFADYVSYWFRIAHDRVPDHGRVGLVGTNSIREGHTRRATLDYIVDHGGVINEAVSSLEWDGDAQVHVSIVNWSKNDDGKPKTLWIQEGQARLTAPVINTDLTVY